MPSPGDSLVFAGAAGLLNTNNLTAFTNTGWICFSNGGFVVRGSALTFAGAAGITNLAGLNELAVGLAYPSLSGTVPLHVASNSTLVMSGPVTNLAANGNSGLFNKTGGGRWVLLEADSRWEGGAFIRDGALVVDGGSLVVDNGSNGNIRLSCYAAAGMARLVLTNSATVILAADSGSLLVGRSGGIATNIVDMYAGTLALTGGAGRIVLGQDTGNSAFFNQHGGVVHIAGDTGNGGEVRIGHTGTNLAAVYSLNGGILRARTVVRTATNNVGVFHFNGGTLEATAGSAAFMENLSAADVQNGGAIIDSAGFDIAIPQALTAGGSGGLVKLGAGVLALGGSNTYAGATVVSGGELLVAGSLGAGSVAVDGATLSGTGTIGGAVTVGTNAWLAPGNGGIGVLTGRGAVTLRGTAAMELDRTQAPSCDRLVASNLVYGGRLVVTNVGPALRGGDRFRIFAAGSYGGGFAEAPVLPPLDDGQAWSNSLALDGAITVLGATNGPVRSNLLARTKYNFLFIAVDDLKPIIGAFGDPGGHPPHYPLAKTPNMDALGARGMLFTRAYCQMALCSPSRSSLMTGLRPDTTKVWDLDTHFRTNIPNTVTLGQHLGANGYRTYGLSKIYHIGFNDPATWTDGWVNPTAPYTYYEAANAAREDAGDGQANATDCGEVNTRRGNTPITDEAYKDGIVVTNALNRLRYYAGNYHSNGVPFFLAVGFVKPHLPFNSPKAYWDLYDTNDIDVSAYDGSFDLPLNTLSFTAPGSGEPCSYTYIGSTLSPSNGPPQLKAQAKRLIHGYLAAASYTDANIGKLLRSLVTNNVASNTVVVLWGDHGWHLGDHGAFWAKHSNFEQATRSLLIVSVPGMDAIGTAGRKCGAPVEFVDIYPTLVDLAGLPGPDQPPGLELQGQSFAPLLEDPNQPWKKGAISQYTRTISGAGIAHPGSGMGYSVRTVRYRYTEWWRTQTGSNRGVKIYSAPEYTELYDYGADPAESTNFAAAPAYTGVVTEMKAMLAGGMGWDSMKAPYAYPTNWPDWQAACAQPGYGASELSEEKDPDADGLANLEEYSFGLNPLLADANPVIAEVPNLSGTNWLARRFPRVSSRADVRAGGSQSAVLADWTRAGVVDERMTNGYPAGIWRARIPIRPGESDAGFLRLETERVP